MTEDSSTPSGRRGVGRLFEDGRTNALLGWVVVGVLGALFVESALDADVRWMAFVAGTGSIVLIPPVVYREWRVMLPWELLALVTFSIVARGLFAGPVGTFAHYLAIAGLALIVTVELHMFTPLAVTHWFAVVLVVLTTMATVAAWTVFRWFADLYLGTSFLVDNETLMVEWASVTAAGIVAGILFDVYFTHRDGQLREAIRGLVSR